jgi:hypothetical protein
MDRHAGSRIRQAAPGNPLTGATRRSISRPRKNPRYVPHGGRRIGYEPAPRRARPRGKARVVEIALPTPFGSSRTHRSPVVRAHVRRRVEVSAALACVNSDVDVARPAVRARDTKAHTPDHVVKGGGVGVGDTRNGHVATLTPGERLFRGIDRWQVGDTRRARLTALGLPHAPSGARLPAFLRDPCGPGWHPYEVVAQQLGHAEHRNGGEGLPTVRAALG